MITSFYSLSLFISLPHTSSYLSPLHAVA
jgi:hypothetical protein